MNEGKRRLVREYRWLKSLNCKFLQASPYMDDLYHWSGLLYGFEGTCWEDSIIKLDIQFAEGYPATPPLHVRVITPIFHPNVDSEGNVCLDILNTEWSEDFNVYTILIAIYSLILNPNVENPINIEAANLYTQNIAEYSRIVFDCLEQTWEMPNPRYFPE